MATLNHSARTTIVRTQVAVVGAICMESKAIGCAALARVLKTISMKMCAAFVTSN